MGIFNYVNYILTKYSDSHPDITPMKLQKLLFYTKAWSLVAGKKLIPEKFIHMKYGPVNQAVYDEYKSFCKDPITKPEGEPESFINPEHIPLVDFILENYVDYHALTLSAMTHVEVPWKNTKNLNVIQDEVILKHYKKYPFAKNFPIDFNKPYYPVMTDMNHSFILDMNKDDAVNSIIFSSYAEYKEFKESAKFVKEKINKLGLTV